MNGRMDPKGKVMGNVCNISGKFNQTEPSSSNKQLFYVDPKGLDIGGQQRQSPFPIRDLAAEQISFLYKKKEKKKTHYKRCSLSDSGLYVNVLS